MLKNDKVEKLIAEQPEELDIEDRQSIVLHRVLHAYKESQERKLNELDFKYVVWVDEIPEVVQVLRACEIKTFTISDGYVLHALPGLLNEGCKIIDCIYINNECSDSATGEYEKIPALRLRLPN